MEKANVKGLSIGYRRKGKGQTLLLLHGGVSDSRYWERELTEYSQDYEVIAWDAPGCGVSDDPSKGFLLKDFAESLAGLCEALKVSEAVVLGLSFGGGLAIEFAYRYPNLTKGLILVSAYAGWAGSLSPEEVSERLKKGRAQVHMAPEEVADLWLPSLFHSTPTDAMLDHERKIIKDFHPSGSLIMLEAFAKADLRDVLPKITAPAVLLYGEEDVRAPIHVAKGIHEKLPSSKLVHIPQVGHLVNLEASERFDQEVRKFLDHLF